MPLLKEISDQLHLCAALMSDHATLELRSAFVADQFVAAMRKIEELRSLLRRPERAEPGGYQNWMDESILDAGVKRMVGLILERHLMPLRLDKFPVVFDQDLSASETAEGKDQSGELSEEQALMQRLKQELDRQVATYNETKSHESLQAVETIKRQLFSAMEKLKKMKASNEHQKKYPVVKEIKESCSMGAMVLLYYYLQWHILLIAINSKLYPCARVYENKTAADLDLVSFLEELPDGKDMLDLRILSRMFDGSKTAFGESHKDLMVDSSHKDVFKTKQSKIRKSSTIMAYKKVLHEMKDALSHEEDWWVFKSEGVDANALCHFVTFESIFSNLKLFNGVISTFDLQDNVQKWNDFYTRFEIKTDIKDTDKEKYESDKSSAAVYTYSLAEVLKSDPYTNDVAEFRKTMQHCVIHDYASSAIMMDVSRSLLCISKLIGAWLGISNDTHEMEKKTLEFISSVCTRPNLKPMKREEAFASGSDRTLTAEKIKVIGKASTSYKKPTKVTDMETFNEHIAVGDLYGYYWGARPVSIENLNHRYLTIPNLEIPDQDLTLLDVIQNVLDAQADAKYENKTAFILQPLVRNSLFISNTAASMKLLIDRLKPCHFFAQQVYDIKLEILPSKGYINMFCSHFGAPESAKDIIAAFDPDSQGNELMSYKDALGLLDAESSELNRYIAEIKQSKFCKFPSLSWPLQYPHGTGEATADNYNAFRFKEPVISAVPSTQVSTYNLSLYMKDFVERSKQHEA